MKNQTGHDQISEKFFLFTKYCGISMTFEIYFLMRFNSKMNNSFGEKMAIAWFYFVNFKGKWAYLAKKNLRAGAKITTVSRLSQKYFDQFIIKTFGYWAAKSRSLV